MQRLIYISESYIEQSDQQTLVLQIVAPAQIKNAKLGLTGALIFTGRHFAQVLEGSQASIQMLMAYICTDPRHGNIKVVDQTQISSRRFPDWHMAYQGPSKFVSCHVGRLQHSTSQFDQRSAAAWLHDLAHELAKRSEPSGSVK